MLLELKHSKCMSKSNRAFTLIELLVVIVIIGILATLSTILITNVIAKARDVKRKAELSQLGKFLTASCYTPDAGAGTYDLLDLINELKNKDERYKQLIGSNKFSDPKHSDETHSNYTYIVTSDKKCVLYANLENGSEAITLNNINMATPGAGNGVFSSSTPGINGTNKYFQASN